MSTFEDAIDTILEHEGGYVNNPSDPGGETKYGICKRVYPSLDIKNLTKEKAIAIYRRDYWRPYYSLINHQDTATKIFDMAVNMGHSQANKIVQRAVNVTADGIIGKQTIAAINKDNQAINKICAEQAKFYRQLSIDKPKLAVFLNGWLKRANWGTA